MTTMNVSLTKEQQAYVQMKVLSGDYASASEYVRQLIREDQRRDAKDRLETKLLAALESGSASLTEQHLAQLDGRLKDAIRKRRATRQKKSS